jgi:outer membrane protein
MKQMRMLLVLAGLFSAFYGWAQPSQGWWMVAGSAGFNSYSFGDYTASVIYVDPRAGYFVTDQIEVGAEIQIELYGGDDEGNSLGVGPFARYYFNKSGPARFFGHVGVNISSFKFDKDEDAISNFGFDLGAGVDYFLNEHVALEAMLAFNSNKDNDDDESATNIGLNIGVAAFIGGGN